MRTEVTAALIVNLGARWKWLSILHHDHFIPYKSGPVTHQ